MSVRDGGRTHPQRLRRRDLEREQRPVAVLLKAAIDTGEERPVLGPGRPAVAAAALALSGHESPTVRFALTHEPQCFAIV